MTAASAPAASGRATWGSSRVATPWLAVCAGITPITSRLGASCVATPAVPASGTEKSTSTSGRTATIARAVSSISSGSSTSTCRTPSTDHCTGDSRETTSRPPRARKLIRE